MKVAVSWLAAACALLAACTSEPGEADMRTAVERAVSERIDAERKAVEDTLGKTDPEQASRLKPPAFPGFKEFKKRACVAATALPGHVCDFSYTLSAGPRLLEGSGQGRFYSGSANLVFEDHGRTGQPN